MVGPRRDVARFRRQARGGADVLPVVYALQTDALGDREAEVRPNPLDLDRLRPPDEESHERISEKLGDLYMDPKWNTWDVHVGRTKTVGAHARLEYSFMTAWCEPLGPIAYASQDHPTLVFVLAAVADEEYTSAFVHRGRIRRWRMSERTWEKLADYEEEDEEEGEFLADYQPRIMEALLAHWENAIAKKMASVPKRRR